MKLCMLSVFVLIFVIRTHGQTPPPLPTPDYEVVKRFEVALDAVSGVALRLQAFLRNDDENVVVSPIGAAVVIGQLILGAKGEFRKQLVELLVLSNGHQYENDTISYHNKNKNVTYVLPYSNLHLQLSNLLKVLESGQDPSKHFFLTKKSALFLDNRIVLTEIFERSIKILYGTIVHRMDFAGDSPIGTLWKMSNLVALNTHGHLDPISLAPPPPNTSSIFVNAISLKAQWKIPFDAQFTRLGIFKSATKSFSVPYMVNQLEQILYAESSEYRIIALPYTNQELGMYIMLPKSSSQYKYDMKGFLQLLKFGEVLDTVSKAKRRNVVVRIPKMTLSTSLSIIDQLKKYRAFEQRDIKLNANSSLDKLEEKVDKSGTFTANVNRDDIFLTGAAIGETLHVDDVILNVRISFDEGGSGGAAVSAVTPINYVGSAENFDINRPFIFFIRHETTSAMLFWGAITKPTDYD